MLAYFCKHLISYLISLDIYEHLNFFLFSHFEWFTSIANHLNITNAPSMNDEKLTIGRKKWNLFGGKQKKKSHSGIRI